MIQYPQNADSMTSRPRGLPQYWEWGYTDPEVARMDPLSITASVITLLGTVATSAKALEVVRNYRNAPKQVTDLRAVVSMIEHSINGLSDDEKRKHRVICQSLYDLASRANGTLQELNGIVKKVFPRTSAAGSEEPIYVLSRRLWLLEKSAIAVHFSNLQKTRKNLDSALNSLNTARV
ncbi:hypothetical protein LX32DRAFT_696266 [Colletotrichum zoysiae]|uniref:Azaphilone pigments biosynthesis cluster protein L N-terminal domain-containing protein n=1 Tax=Colletotrichum zoysiae TaxID=1216348 RepID=A0AAD9M172_9PEZI|nr:hypothetical protein LX32DRAFT_696266 [Colletotrichum zoysiae]